MFLTKVVEKIKTHFFLFNNFFPPENRAVYGVTWKNIVEPEQTQKIWRMRFARWIHKATNIHSEYETLLAFSL
jgi:hypothetical protein